MYSCHSPGRLLTSYGVPRLLRYQFDHHVLAVGIDGKPQQQDHVVENGGGFGVLRGDQVVGELDGVLRGRDFGGVQAAVDVHDDFAVVRQLVRLRVVEAFDQREPPRRVLILIEVGEILARTK